MSILHKLTWRYATKKFNPDLLIEEQEVTELMKAANLAPSSYGLQPYDFFVIKDKALQARLKDVSYGQEQVHDASHLIVIAAKTSISDDFINDFVKNTADLRGQDINELTEYADMMKNTVHGMNDHQLLSWTQRQSYIALGVLLTAAADLKIDASPMEGFEAESYNEILGLHEQGLHATVIVGLGERSADDSYQGMAKVRRPLSDIVHLKYEDQE